MADSVVVEAEEEIDDQLRTYASDDDESMLTDDGINIEPSKIEQLMKLPAIVGKAPICEEKNDS
jgi:hypothetical protein